MKRVVHITDSASRLAGGMYESVRGMCAGEAMSGAWEPTVVASQDAHSQEDRMAWGATPLRLAPRSRFGAFGSAPDMARLMVQALPSVVHLHGIWGPGSLAVAQLPDGPGKPSLVVSPRGMLEPWGRHRSRFRKFAAWHAWMRLVISRTDCFHALCEEEAVSIRKIAPETPIAVIANGIVLPELASRTAATRLKTVLFLGRIHPKKGIAELLAAWARLAEARANGWRLIIAGWDDGGYEADLKRQANRLGLGDSVTFYGPAFGDAKTQLFRSSTVFALPSFSEGLPMAILEAWSYATPVLMTDECHLGIGFASNAAVRVEPTPDSIAAGLKLLIEGMDDTERDAIGARGRALVESHFSWQRIGAEMTSVYDWLLGGAVPASVASANTHITQPKRAIVDAQSRPKAPVHKL